MSEVNYFTLADNPGWLVDAGLWVRQALAGVGRALQGDLQPVRLMPWAAVYRGATDAGDVYLKAVAGTQAHEPALVRFLAARRPDCNLPVLAADLDRGWLLLPDGGHTVGHSITEEALLFAAWVEVLPLAASLQRTVETDVDALRAIGVPVKSLGTLLDVYHRLLDEPERLRIGHPEGLAAEEVEALRRTADSLARVFDELAAASIPDSLVHEEPHERHVFLREDSGGRRYTFYDWGDACIGHPFMWAMMPLRNLAEDYPEAATSRLEPLITAYLAPWEGVAPEPVLRRAIDAAMPAAALTRAQTWMMVEDVYGTAAPQKVLDLYPQAMAYWLRRVHDWVERYEARRPLLP